MTTTPGIRQRVAHLQRTKVLVDETTGCWGWLGAKQKEGYGTVSFVTPGRRTSTTAHRLFYEALVGPIPTGHTVHHKCANTSCVNPAHLETATQRANTAEMFARKALERSRDAADEALDGLEDSLRDAAVQSTYPMEETPS